MSAPAGGRSGERILAAAFGLAGLLFAAKARDLTYMDEFAPGAGFLPFWLGLVLVALVAAFLLTTRAPGARGVHATGGAPDTGGAPAPVSARKVAAVAAGLGACIVLIGWLGFAVSSALFLLFLLRGVERRRWGVSSGVALGTTAGLYLIFQTWLKVPLPRGPWGF